MLPLPAIPIQVCPVESAVSMPISGLVVAFDGPAEQYECSISELQCHPNIEVGEIAANKCAIVLETLFKQQDLDVWQWMHELPGVIDILIAFVGFDDEIENRIDAAARDDVVTGWVSDPGFTNRSSDESIVEA